MTNNDTYRLVGGNHYHEGEYLETGDTFEPTDAELESFGHKLEKVETDESSEDDDGDGEPIAAAEAEGGSDVEYGDEATDDEDDGPAPDEVDNDDVSNPQANVDLEELSHDELKARAKALGIADGIDLRSKQPIIDALEDADTGGTGSNGGPPSASEAAADEDVTYDDGADTVSVDDPAEDDVDPEDDDERTESDSDVTEKENESENENGEE